MNSGDRGSCFCRYECENVKGRIIHLNVRMLVGKIVFYHAVEFAWRESKGAPALSGFGFERR